ncbi:hypothetical protein [Caldiplasma sukawensis]
MINIIECEQVLYGWVSKKNQEGYQLISKSESINPIDLSYLDRIKTPGTFAGNAREAYRFLLLPSGSYAFCYIKDIGKDIYGRDGAMMNHCLIIKATDFEKINRDIYSFINYFMAGITSVNDFEKLRESEKSFHVLPVLRIEYIKNKDEEDRFKNIFLNHNDLTKVAVKSLIYLMLGNVKNVLIKNYENLSPLNLILNYISLINFNNIIMFSTAIETNYSSLFQVMPGAKDQTENENSAVMDYEHKLLQIKNKDPLIDQISESVGDNIIDFGLPVPLEKRTERYSIRKLISDVGRQMMGNYSGIERMQLGYNLIKSNYIEQKSEIIEEMKKTAIMSNYSLDIYKYILLIDTDEINTVNDEEDFIEKLKEVIDKILQCEKSSEAFSLVKKNMNPNYSKGSKLVDQIMGERLSFLDIEIEKILDILKSNREVYYTWYKNMDEYVDTPIKYPFIFDVLFNMKEHYGDAILFMEKILKDMRKEDELRKKEVGEILAKYYSSIESQDMERIRKIIRKKDPDGEIEKVIQYYLKRVGE